MNYFPSPPSSPLLMAADETRAMCGSCNKLLSSDWYCSDCHTKCNTCNRFLSSHDEHCSRCWKFDQLENCFVRKERSVFTVSLFYQHLAFQQQQQQRRHQHRQSNLMKKNHCSLC